MGLDAGQQPVHAVLQGRATHVHAFKHEVHDEEKQGQAQPGVEQYLVEPARQLLRGQHRDMYGGLEGLPHLCLHRLVVRQVGQQVGVDVRGAALGQQAGEGG